MSARNLQRSPKDRNNKYVGIHGGERSFRDEFGLRFNVWRYANGGNQTSLDKLAFLHPAPFPDQLAADHIKSWSNENDLVADFFAGSGTVPKMAKLLKRNFIGTEISQEYVNISNERLKLIDNVTI